MWTWSLMSVHDLVLPCFLLTQLLISVDDNDTDVWPKNFFFSLHEENAKPHIDWSSSFTRPTLLLQRHWFPIEIPSTYSAEKKGEQRTPLCVRLSSGNCEEEPMRCLLFIPETVIFVSFHVKQFLSPVI